MLGQTASPLALFIIGGGWWAHYSILNLQTIYLWSQKYLYADIGLFRLTI
jgi:hypothetical protein